MRLAIACLIGTALAAAAAPIPKDQKTNAEKVIGKWRITKQDGKEPDGGKYFVEFTKDGKMILKIEPTDGEAITLKGTYKVDGDKLDYKMELPDGGQKQEVLTIEKLTDEEMVTKDPEGIKEEFKKVKEKKDK